MRRLAVALAVVLGVSAQAVAAIPDGTAPQVASISNRDDGADYVWRVFCASGLRYSYIPASQFPLSSRFELVSTPQTGDIAWWPEFVGIFVSQTQQIITQAGFVKLADLSADGSQPRYYRMRILPGEQTSQKPQAGQCERSLL